MRMMNQQATRISVPTPEGIEIFDCSEILRCEADRTSSFVYLADGTHVLSTKSLKHFEKMLGGYDFLRVHKANLVNIFHIRKYLKGKKTLVVMTDSTLVEVASRKKNQLLKIISSFPVPPASETVKNKTASDTAARQKSKSVRPVIAAERKPKSIVVPKALPAGKPSAKAGSPVIVARQKAS